MKAFLRQFPLHTVIVLLLPLIIITLKNQAVIKLSFLPGALIYLLAIALVSFAVAFLVLKKRIPAFIFTTFVLASGFYFYTAIQKAINLIESKYVKDIYCFSVWAILCVAILFVIKKKITGPRALQLNSYLNMFAAFLLLANVVTTSMMEKKEVQSFNPQHNDPVKFIEKQNVYAGAKKNVYYILMDECTNEKTLEKIFSYKSSFDNRLSALNFFVCKNAVSSYSETFYSMSSTLNLRHIDVNNTQPDYYNNNSVNYIYHKNGYQTEMITSFFVKNYGRYMSDSVYDPYNEDFFENEFITSILENTAFRMVYKLMFFKHGINYHAAGLNNFFKMADSLVSVRPRNPRFLYMHINSPHGPLSTDSSGRPAYTYVTTAANYLDQLIYTQKSVVTLVEKILKQENGNCIIIIQSDHGIRQHSSPVVLPDKNYMYNVINAVYFPDSQQQHYFTDSMNIVNNFRMIFNYQFNYGLKKIPD